MSKIKYILLLAAGLGMVSCEGLLEQKNPNLPDADTYWTNEEEVNDGLNAAYRALRFNGEYRRYLYMLLTQRSDEGYTESPSDEFQSGSNFLTNLTSNSVYFTWLDIYKGIFWANQVLYNGADVEFDDPQRKEQIMGQAHFLRGLGLFNIAVIYGRGPAPLVPDMSEYNQGYEILEQTALFEEARKAFLEAAKRTPPSWDKADLGRITQGASWAMLAKTAGQLAGCYEMNDDAKARTYWTEMKLYCDSVINSGLYTVAGVNYEDNFNEATEFNAESVFELQFAPDAGGVSQLCHELAKFYGLPFKTKAGNEQAYKDGYARYSVKQEFERESQASGAPDPRMRATLYYNDPTDQTLYYGQTLSEYGIANNMAYWKKYTQWRQGADFAETHSNNGINIRLIRLADIHLMRAEAMNELGMPQADILADINVVRSRVNMPSLPSTIYPASAFDTKDKMRIQIMHERTCELAGEFWRWPDLDRWFFRDKDGDGIKETMVDSYQIEGKSPLEWLRGRDAEFNNFNYERDGNKYFRYPVPTRELPLVDGLTQNQGW